MSGPALGERWFAWARVRLDNGAVVMSHWQIIHKDAPRYPVVGERVMWDYYTGGFNATRATVLEDGTVEAFVRDMTAAEAAKALRASVPMYSIHYHSVQAALAEETP